MSISCSDVCEQVIERLLQLGFKINTEDEDHTDIMDALGCITMTVAKGMCPKCFQAFFAHNDDGSCVVDHERR